MNLEREILNAIQELSQRMDRLEQEKEKDKQEILAAIEEIRSEVKTIGEQLHREAEQWDERFYQLSRDSLNFLRNVITAGVIVAILVPAVKEAVPLIVSTLRAPQ